MLITILKNLNPAAATTDFFLKNMNTKKNKKTGKLCFKQSCFSSNTGFNMHNILYG
jgi:hypothetical protein